MGSEALLAPSNRGAIHLIAVNKTSQTDLPRVLFLTREIPQGANAGSQQLLRVLRDYPPERLCVIGPPHKLAAELLGCAYHSYPLPITRWINSRVHRLINTANVFGMVPIARKRWLNERVEKFNPDVIVTVMDCFSYYSIAANIARRHRLSLLTITMDRPDLFERVPRFWRRKQFKGIGQIYSQAALNLVVSRQMARWLRLVFRAQSRVHYFAPSADLPRSDPEACRAWRTPDRFVIGYAGSLEYGYERQIAAMLPEIEAAGAVLRVYSAHCDRLPKSAALDLRPFVPATQLWNELVTACDALLLPYPFSHESASLYRTHFPTKLAEYFTLGLPVVLVGPRTATGVRWGLDHLGSSIVLTDRDPATWRTALARLQTDGELRVQLARESQVIAARHFSPSVQHQQFHRALVDATR